MTIDLLGGGALGTPWTDAAAYWSAMTDAVADVSGPVAAINLAALRYNALDMVVRSGGVPIRVASKSVRVREVIDAALAIPGYRGILAFTLPEALWLAQTHDDVVLGYPSVDRAALAALAADEQAASRVTLMVDDVAQLDLVDAVAPPGVAGPAAVAIDADASWRAPGLGHIGVRRSPVHEPGEVAALARAIAARPGFRLVGLMMYEAQIAGQADATGSGDGVIRWMQRRSAQELLDRRAAIVAALREVAPLEFVNGGGTGSLELTASDLAVTELTAGSGLLAGHLFDGYRAFDPAPAAAFALEVVRKPAPDIATVLGGGWIASGPPVASRQPLPVWPEGLTTLGREGAGEVQTPLQGASARALRVGDRVWFRHAKSGELAERVDRYRLVGADGAVGRGAHVSRRGEGVPMTRPGATWQNWGRSATRAPAAGRVPELDRGGAARRHGRGRPRDAGQGGRRRPQLHGHRRRPRRAARSLRPHRSGRRRSRTRPRDPPRGHPPARDPGSARPLRSGDAEPRRHRPPDDRGGDLDRHPRHRCPVRRHRDAGDRRDARHGRRRAAHGRRGPEQRSAARRRPRARCARHPRRGHPAVRPGVRAARRGASGRPRRGPRRRSRRASRSRITSSSTGSRTPTGR